LRIECALRLRLGTDAEHQLAHQDDGKRPDRLSAQRIGADVEDDIVAATSRRRRMAPRAVGTIRRLSARSRSGVDGKRIRLGGKLPEEVLNQRVGRDVDLRRIAHDRERRRE